LARIALGVHLEGMDQEESFGVLLELIDKE
jgi:hypothetical protein